MDNKIVAGIDIGGTNIIISFITESGDIINELSIKTASFSEAIDFVKEASSDIKRSCSENNYKLLGIGIGAPNGNYYSGSIEFAPNLKWKGVIPLVDMFSEYFDIPVRLTNDANAAAIGEMVFGGAQNMKHFIVVTLGTGLGSGIVVDGKVLYGNDGFAGELGHTIVEDNGRQCGCGRKGCLETYVSATGIVSTVKQLVETSENSNDVTELLQKEITAHNIYIAATNGNKIALNAFEYTGEMLGKSLSNTVALFSPQAIFLFGGLAKSGDYIINPTKRHMEQNMLTIFKNKVDILPSALDEHHAAVLGAAGLIWDLLKK